MPKNLIIHFPWGGAGNLVRNIISISPSIEMLDEQGRPVGTDNPDYPDKTEFMMQFFTKQGREGPWLKTEWSIREHLYFKYYSNHAIAYWNPDTGVAYDTHGMQDELDSIRSGAPLLHWNRYLIDNEGMADQVCPDKALDFHHVFVMPRSIDFIAEHYWCKNPQLSPQFNNLDTMEQKVTASRAAIGRQCDRLEQFYKELQQAGRSNMSRIVADDLFRPDGWVWIMSIVDKLELCVNIATVRRIHEIWQQETQATYEKHFKKAFPLL